ncbi:MAG TPA: ELWxxDGT repeat protein, partial [Thermoanaerobaculia bacterium]|nr:ELWxxDGT repeat protein [Thermoanaerobaculia bacterium]
DGGLWRTDGTSDDTIRLIALDPMSASAGMVAASGKLWFVRDDGVHGKELWRSDGTVAGTVMVADLEPGPAGSNPTELAVAGGRVFFSAQTRAAGRELFAVEPEGSDIAIADIRVAEGNSGTVIARFVVTRGGNLQSPLEVSFATANGTATAGTDYVAQSGVLAFGAGETTKTIDVVVNGEAEIEGEETFFVILSVAATERMRATAIISADDRRAELSLVHTDALGSVRIVNAGPSMATNVRLRYSASPGYSGGSCWNEMPCTLQAGFLAPGESLLFRLEPGSVDVSNRHDPLQPPALRVAASVTAMELDSNPADNIVEASAVGGLLLPPFLVAGGNAAATYFTLNSASVTISSDGAITATPSSFSAAFDSATPVTLAAAATPGFSVLSVAVGSWEPRKGRIQIVAPGGTAKRDVRINVETYVHYAETISIPVQIAGTLHDGTRPAGTAELLDGAIVLATAGLDATGRGTFSISGVTTGDHDWHVRYSGDANFHGLTVAASIHIRPVSTTTTMTSAQTGCVFEGVVTVTASNGSRPAGEVAMRVDSIEVARLTLHPADGGKATAAYRVTLPPGQHLLQASFVPAEPFDTSAATVWATAPDCAPVLAAT